MVSPHLSEETVEKYSMGKLDDPESAVVEEHLLLCDSCQEQVALLDTLVETVRGYAEIIESRPPTLWDRLRDLINIHPGSAWAGAAVLTMGAMVLAFLPASPTFPQHIKLNTVRGSESAAPQARSDAPIELQLDVNELPVSTAYTVELINASGQVVRTFTSKPSASKITVPIAERLTSGQYWIRLYATSLKTELLREFALRVS